MSASLKEILEKEDYAVPYLIRIAGWTEERYFEEAPEMRFVEFEDGDIIMHSPVNIRHQELVRFLTILLGVFVRTRNIGKLLNGPAVVQLRHGLDYEPDLFIVPADQFDRLQKQCFSGIPLLVVEIISPSTRTHDLKSKAANYHAQGVPEYWAIDPDRKTLYQHIISPDSSTAYLVRLHTQGRLESEAVSGFWIDVDWLWQEPLPNELDCLQQVLAT